MAPKKLPGYRPFQNPGRATGPGTPMGSPTMAAPLSVDPTAQNPGYRPPQPPPLDPTFDAQVGLNQRTYNDANVGYDQQQSATIRAYGLDDPTDPYSKLQLLQQAFENRKRGATNSYAARGQLYSGAAQRAQNTVAQGYGQDYNSLRTGQNDALARILQGRAAARGALEQGNIDATSGAIDRAAQTPVDPATVPAPVKKKKQKNFRLV